MSKEVAAVQRLMKASGLSYEMHSAGTTVGKASSVQSTEFVSQVSDTIVA